MKKFIYTIILLTICSTAYSKDTTDCYNEYSICVDNAPEFRNEYTIVKKKTIPNPTNCDTVFVLRTNEDNPRVRYSYQYTGEESKKLNLIDFNRDTSPNPKMVKFRLDFERKKEKYIVDCKIKEDICRDIAGYGPRHVSFNLKEGKIFIKYRLPGFNSDEQFRRLMHDPYYNKNMNYDRILKEAVIKYEKRLSKERGKND